MIWTAGFLAFPLAGVAGTAVAGRVDSPLAALLGGAVAGLVIGATGAATFCALSGILLHRLLPYRAATGPHTPIEARV